MHPLTIYIDRLKDGRQETISEQISPTLMEIAEKELSFPDPIVIKGKVYIANDHLVMHFDIATTARVPCMVCNDFFTLALSIKNFYHTLALSELPSPQFNFWTEIREAILLQIPQYSECHQGKCPERKIITGFLKNSSKPAVDSTNNFPFADLEKN